MLFASPASPARRCLRVPQPLPTVLRAPTRTHPLSLSLRPLLSSLIPSSPPQDAAEFGRIGKYYATESMLVWDEAKGQYDADATPEYGVDTLEAFFKRAVTEGLDGQELGDQAVFGVGE